MTGDEEQYIAERDKTESDIRKCLSFRTKTNSEGRCFLESRYCGKVVEREEVEPRRGEQVIAKAMLSSRRIVVNEINGEYASIRKEYEKKMQKSDLSPKKEGRGKGTLEKRRMGAALRFSFAGKVYKINLK